MKKKNNKTLYTLEDKISYLLKVIDSCETIEHLNGAANMLQAVEKQHIHESHRLKPVTNAIVDKFEDLCNEMLQSKQDDISYEE